MPYKGHKVITVRDETYEKIKVAAEKQRRSMGNYIEVLIEQYQEVPAS